MPIKYKYEYKYSTQQSIKYKYKYTKNEESHVFKYKYKYQYVFDPSPDEYISRGILISTKVLTCTYIKKAIYIPLLLILSVSR